MVGWGWCEVEHVSVEDACAGDVGHCRLLVRQEKAKCAKSYLLNPLQ